MTNATRPRLLFVGAFPPPERQIFGGQVTACRTLLESSFPRHFELDLIDSTQITNPPPGFFKRLYLAGRRFADFLWRVERGRPGVVLLFLAIGASVVEKGAMAWYARLRGIPAVLFPRGGQLMDRAERSPAYRRFLRIAFGGGTMVFCQSPRWHTFVIDVLRFPPERAPVIMNWTATSDALALGRERKLNVNDVPRLLFVGWLDREKGIDELLEACRTLHERGKADFDLRVAGEGNRSDAARAFVKLHGLSSKVEFCGWLEGEALHQELRKADIFVLPSWSEGLPNAMIEAMAARLVVVVTPVGSIPDVIANGIDGVVIPVKDANALADALEGLLADPAAVQRLANAGFEKAEKQFGVEEAVERIVSAINTAMVFAAHGLDRNLPTGKQGSMRPIHEDT